MLLAASSQPKHRAQGRSYKGMSAPRNVAAPGEALQYGIPNPKAAPSRRRRSSAMPILERIQTEIESHPIVLFMKGTPQFPMCGFSSRTVQALRAAGADPAALHTVNVLEEPEIRANLPRYSNWPTFPQLFIHGELIGRCDITCELAASGATAS